jgi:hypothetical protein
VFSLPRIVTRLAGIEMKLEKQAIVSVKAAKQPRNFLKSPMATQKSTSKDVYRYSPMKGEKRKLGLETMKYRILQESIYTTTYEEALISGCYGSYDGLIETTLDTWNPYLHVIAFVCRFPDVEISKINHEVAVTRYTKELRSILIQMR